MRYLLTALVLSASLFLPQVSAADSPQASQDDLLLLDVGMDTDAMTPYEKALARIAEAKASGAVILNLSGLGLTVIPDEIGTLENLQGLNLFGVKVTDLRPLSKLTQLKELNLYYVPVSDIRPLAKLTMLVHLDLSYTSVSDVTPLAKLSRLRYLDLWNSPVTDYSQLDPLIENGLVVLDP